VHQGTVKKVDGERRYGFLSCQALHQLYGSDVFVPQRQLGGFAVGDRVSFVVRVDRKGRPQASELAPCSPPEAAAEAEAGEDEGPAALAGTIKSFEAEHGYGFISSPEVQARYGRDVFLHAKQIKHFRPGDHVAFSVRINSQGRPQAYGLREAPQTVAWLAAGEEEAPAAEVERYLGEVKSFSSAHGYGFIECPALHERYGRDVFVHQSQLEGVSVGARVSFRVQVKRGQPQACGVAPAPSAEGPGGAGPHRAPPEQQLAAPELARKLLRACASARAESVQVVQELLAAGADANARDITGQRPLMVAALNARHSERKCRLLIESRADLLAMYNESLSVLQWARERINPKFADFLEGLQHGESLEYTVALDIPRDND